MSSNQQHGEKLCVTYNDHNLSQHSNGKPGPTWLPGDSTSLKELELDL